MSSDKLITGHVLAGLDVSPFLVGADIDVETKDGVVTLTGTVLDSKQKAEAEETVLASDPDVKKVENKLEIKELVLDSLMALRSISGYNLRLLPAVKKALLQHPWLDVTGIHITAEKGREGIFRLSGTVPGEKDVGEAEQTVNSVPGVKYAINELEVGELKEVGNIAPSKESKSDPKVCGSLMEKYAVSSRNLTIINDIKTALFSHPVLDATDVNVLLAKGCDVGIYRLEGTVPNEKHKAIAEEVASAVRGVQYIDNKLVVE
ncbi:MAG: BON domain-containing protein [bacterium]|jgi:hyperosmotically inducible protein